MRKVVRNLCARNDPTRCDQADFFFFTEPGAVDVQDLKHHAWESSRRVDGQRTVWHAISQLKTPIVVEGSSTHPSHFFLGNRNSSISTLIN